MRHCRHGNANSAAVQGRIRARCGILELLAVASASQRANSARAGALESVACGYCRGGVLSSVVERLLYTERVGGSKPSAPTNARWLFRFMGARSRPRRRRSHARSGGSWLRGSKPSAPTNCRLSLCIASSAAAAQSWSPMRFLAARYDFARRGCDDSRRSVSCPAPRSGSSVG